ncbi:MAG: phosphoribosylamine--glycine ligase [Nitrospirota bacterium]
MKVLVIGGGGREHAIVWKLSQSKHIDKVYCCPGNAGITGIAECVDISLDDFKTLIDFVKYEWIDLTVVCHEASVLSGIVNAFEREGCRVLGPSKEVAQVFAHRSTLKSLMRFYRIPATEFKVFTSYLHAEDYVRLKGAPIVIKTDTCDGCDGTIIALAVEGAVRALRMTMKEGFWGDRGEKVIVEERLKGDEISILVLTDGTTVKLLTSLYKYRHLHEGNRGLYTACAGAYSPVPSVTKELENIILEEVIFPLLRALDSEGIKLRGILSADLIIDKKKPHICNFSCCAGDLEMMTILPRLKTDFADIVLALSEERISGISIDWEKRTSLCVVTMSEGYPGKWITGSVIKGLEKINAMKDVFLFHHNTAFDNGDIVNTGGRVVSLTATGSSIEDTMVKAYGALKEIHFEGMYYRKDIGT